MNDDDLLFGVDDLERWKRRDLPQSWLGDQIAVLIARSRTQSPLLHAMLISADPAVDERLNKPL